MHKHSKSQYSQQSPTLFEPRFLFLDRFNALKHLLGLKKPATQAVQKSANLNLDPANLRVGEFELGPDPHLLCRALEQYFANILAADYNFPAPFRDSG
jgi:hypothetical protein